MLKSRIVTLVIVFFLFSVPISQTTGEVPITIILTDEKGDVDIPSIDIINGSYFFLGNHSQFTTEFAEEPVINSSTSYNLNMEMFDSVGDKYAEVIINIDGENKPIAEFSWKQNTTSPQSDQTKVNTTVKSNNMYMNFEYEEVNLFTNFVSYSNQTYFIYEVSAKINTNGFSETDTLSYGSRTDTNTEPIFDVPFSIGMIYLSLASIAVYNYVRWKRK